MFCSDFSVFLISEYMGVCVCVCVCVGVYIIEQAMMDAQHTDDYRKAESSQFQFYFSKHVCFPQLLIGQSSSSA